VRTCFNVGEVDENVLVPVGGALLVEEACGVQQLVGDDSLVDAAVPLQVDHLSAALSSHVRPATGRSALDVDEVHVADHEGTELEAGRVLDQVHSLPNRLPLLVV